MKVKMKRKVMMDEDDDDDDGFFSTAPWAFGGPRPALDHAGGAGLFRLCAGREAQPRHLVLV